MRGISSGASLVSAWQTMSPDQLTFEIFAAALLEACRGISGERYLDEIRAILRWRGIDVIRPRRLALSVVDCYSSLSATMPVIVAPGLKIGKRQSDLDDESMGRNSRVNDKALSMQARPRAVSRSLGRQPFKRVSTCLTFPVDEMS